MKNKITKSEIEHLLKAADVLEEAGMHTTAAVLRKLSIEDPTPRVWIVEGSSGEYNDHIEWPVCAYLNADSAAEHVTLAQQNIINTIEDVRSNPYDPLMPAYSVDGETQYRFYSIPLLCSIDNVLSKLAQEKVRQDENRAKWLGQPLNKEDLEE